VSLAQDAIKKEFSAEKIQTVYGLSKDAIDFNIGQEQDNQDSFSSMGKAAIPLFVVMIVVMAILFRSIFQPVLILTALPFAIFGVANGLLWTHNEISFFTMLGVFALIGISLNNTILLTDYANQAKARGLNGVEAMAEALQARFRPLLTTSLTSVFALLPLALHDPFWEGLAYALMFGLISSTILVVIVFPYFYLVEESIANKCISLMRRVVKTKRA
jgi:HAE1 family hydrophobic/amphiphilic exporter-1